MNKEICVPMIGLVAGELIMFYGSILAGLGIHIINLLTTVFLITFGNLSSKEKNTLQSLIMLIVLRIVNISMPQFFKSDLLQYALIYGIMFVPIYLTIKNQNISNKELGINFSRLYIYILIAIVIITALAEYRTINTISLIDKKRFSDMVLIPISMLIFIGAIEELIFRSILQTRLEKIFGLRYGLLLTGGIFGIMHSSYGILNEILFASIFGIILGYIFQKTKSLFFTISIHGTGNVILFGILPGLSVIANVHNISSEIISIGGKITSIFLIIVLSISFLISNTKYWSKYVANVFSTYSSPLLLIFVAIVIYKVILVIS